MVEAIRPVPDADFTKLFVWLGPCDLVHVNKNLDKKGSQMKKKIMTYPESNPRPPVRKARIVTTMLCGSQLPTSLSFYLIYVTQEETYIRRNPSKEETKAEPDPNPNVPFACYAQ